MYSIDRIVSILRKTYMLSRSFIVPIYINPLIIFCQHRIFRDLCLGKYEDNPIFDKECYIFSCDNWASEDTKYHFGEKDLILKGLHDFNIRHPKAKVFFLHPQEEYSKNWPGIPYFIFNRNALVKPENFSIVETDKKFDFVYNACFYKYKNHDLMPDDRYNIATITYMKKEDKSSYMVGKEDYDYSHKLLDKYRSKRNIFLPNYIGGKYNFLENSQINNIQNQSRMGLILSEVEGMCIVSMEYLLSGLPVVNVKNIGGRDRFLDSYNSITVNPDKESIDKAIKTILDSKYDRQRIRDKVIFEINKEFENLEKQMIKYEEFRSIDYNLLKENFKEVMKYYYEGMQSFIKK